MASQRRIATKNFGSQRLCTEQNFSKATGMHFNLPGHDETNMKVLVIEKVKKIDDLYRKERETYLIRKFNTFQKGINRMP